MRNKKNALVMSAVSMLLCIAMLAGTTFAWFTDSASTGVNKIQAGNLDIAIVDANGAEIDDLEWVTIDQKAQADILWEPGATYALEPFKIVNKGNLALKYKIVITDGTTSAGVSTAAANLLDVIDFYVFTGNIATTQEGRPDFTEAVSLAEFSTEEMNLGADAQSNVTDTLNIVAKMREEAGNEYQGLALEGMKITVYATQDTVEYDSFDNQYDANATLDFIPVNSQEELTELLKTAEADEDVNISLNTDVALDTFYLLSPDTSNTPELGDITIQANGHEISTAKTGTSRAVRLEYSDVARNITIIGAKITTKNTTPERNEDRGVAIFDVHNAIINLVNCEIVCDAPQYTAGVRIIDSSNLTVNIKDCNITASNPVSLMNTTGCTINIDGCVLNSNYEGTATYLGHGIYIAADATGNTFNVSNTTYNGTYAAPYSDYTDEQNITYNDLGGNVDNTEKLYK